MLKLVLWGNKSPWQIWGASIGVFIGMLLLLFAMQVFFDVQILARGARDSNILILNKRVRTTSEKSFSSAEIDEIRKKPFFKLVEPFESNRYEVWADMKQLGFSTILFFQSISNSFIDVDTTEFKWQEGDELIPVVMSNDYLTLYNFGFGAGQGLPKISADLVSSFTFDLMISGKGNKKKYKMYICGFTKNINSILVPQSFMQYANREFGFQEKKNPNQIAASTDNPYNTNLEKFLIEKDLELSRGGLIGGELKTALNLLVLLVLTIGAIIIGLSLLVFVLNFQLLIAQSSASIKLLLELGYKHQSITKTLYTRLFIIFLLIVAAVFSILFPVKYMITNSLVTQGYESLSYMLSVPVILTGITFSIIFIWINYAVINRNVKKLA
jgi:hypothetical protein